MSKKDTKENKENPMRNIRIEKLIINCSVGEPGDKVNKAAKVLKDLADGKEPVLSKCRFTIRSFGVRRGDKIAAHITLRGDRAQEILQRALKVKEFELHKRNFSNTGCFGFGIEEHIDLGMKYDPYTGIFGMDFFVVLKRPGYRVCQKKVKRGKIGNFHQVTKEEAMEWFKTNYEGTIL